MDRLLPVLGLGALLTACTHDALDGGADGAVAVDAGATDGGLTDPDAGRADAAPLDAAPMADGGSPSDTGPPPRDGGLEHYEAVPGTQCPIWERVGVVEIRDIGASTGALYAWAVLRDRPTPWLGPPDLDDGTCAFYNGAYGCGCSSEQVCSLDGTCVDPPMAPSDLRVEVEAAGQVQYISDASGNGRINEAITLSGRTFSVRLGGFGLSVSAPEMTVPEEVPDLDGTLIGTYDAPERIEFSWTPGPTVATVHTNIPINHHVATPTFTECTVPGSAGSFTVPGTMLTPLAVSTGLEFQNVKHVRLAAAATPLGCVEFRYSNTIRVNIY